MASKGTPLSVAFVRRVKKVQEEPAEAVRYIKRLEANEKQLKKLTESVEEAIDVWNAIGVYEVLRIPSALMMAFIRMKNVVKR